MSAKRSTGNAFDWRGQPSTVFAGDRTILPTKVGGTLSHSSTMAIAERTRKTGRNPGTMTGISRKERTVLSAHGKPKSGVS